jgi:hypothetical protein
MVCHGEVGESTRVGRRGRLCGLVRPEMDWPVNRQEWKSKNSSKHYEDIEIGISIVIPYPL